MQGSELLRTLSKSAPASVYLFVGPDAYRRRQVREALIRAVVGDGDPESAVTRLDLDEIPIPAVIDDASSLSLFASSRLIWVSSAESALPKRLSSKTDDDPDGPAGLLAAYIDNPTPGAVIVFDCVRFGFDGDDKAKLDRVRKFYSAIRDVVEFPYPTPDEAVRLAESIAKELEFPLSRKQASFLVEALGTDAARLENEVRKLATFANGREVGDADLVALVPDARTSNIFALVNAMARRDRREAMEVLESLVREGEYLPLVLTFLGTQFRLALAAEEAKVRRVPEIQAHFTRMGISMWRARAEQLAETMRIFPAARLEEAIILTHGADLALRDTRPDDRTVLENYLWKLTA